MTRACEAIGISYTACFAWRKEDPTFEKEWLETIDRSTEILEAEAYRRAHEGHDVGVYHNGVRVATEKKHSDTLMIFMLKGRRPDKYRERTEMDLRTSAGSSGDSALEAVAGTSSSNAPLPPEDEG